MNTVTLNGWLVAGNDLPTIILVLTLVIVFEIVPTLALYAVVYFLFSLPLRRKERARIFLDLLEVSLRQGRAPETTLLSLAQLRDPMLGAHLQQLGVYLQNGVPLGNALEHVPHILPPKVQAMLRAGMHMGDLRRVLPACRQVLGDATDHARSAMNYLVVLAFVITPVTALMPWILTIFVLPKYVDIFDDMLPGTTLPPLLLHVVQAQPLITLVVFMLLLVLWGAALCYVCGPRLTVGVQSTGLRIFDLLQLTVPWHRKRLQRDFSGVLAALLDHGVPESECILLAADATANELFIRRARYAATRLAQGQTLTEVLTALDGTGEFRWRLSNAIHNRTGFTAALSGWHEALDARASQQEQTASQLFTTSLVLFNGALVALITLGVFGALVAVMEGGLLW